MTVTREPAAASFFQALGDPTRLALLRELRAGSRHVGELVEALGCPQPKVSRHLKVLKEAGLVRDRRDGRNVAYEVSPAAGWPPAARAWLTRLGGGATPAPEGSPSAPAMRRAAERPAAAAPPEARSRTGPAGDRAPRPRETPGALEAHLL